MKARGMKLVREQNGRKCIRYVPCEPAEATHVEMCYPGLFPTRLIPLGADGWTWNQDTERPTLRPSILTHNQMGRCHSFVTNGEIQFLSDCTHELAGKTVALLDVE